LYFYVHKLTLNNFSINSDWSEVAKFVVYFSFSVLSTKEVDTLKNSITLKTKLGNFLLTFLVLISCFELLLAFMPTTETIPP